MSRRHKAEKREVNPDPKFGDLVLTKFMNAVMEQGKKSVAENIVYGALERMDARKEQRFVDVNIPKTGDNGLVEECRLDRTLRARQSNS